MKRDTSRRRYGRLGLAMALALCLPAMALGGPPPRGDDAEERVQHQMERLTQELSLSDEQRREMEPVLLDAARRAQAAFQSSGGNREQMRRSMQKIARETDAKLEQILDPRQMKRYREIVRERRRQHRPPGRPPR